jgi:hypothetical protein
MIKRTDVRLSCPGKNCQRCFRTTVNDVSGLYTPARPLNDANVGNGVEPRGPEGSRIPRSLTADNLRRRGFFVRIVLLAAAP